MSSPFQWVIAPYFFSQILRAKEACVPEEDSSDNECSSDDISENSDSYEKENNSPDLNSERNNTENKNDMRKGRKIDELDAKKKVDTLKKIPWMTNRKSGVLIE